MTDLTIISLGARGDGIADSDTGPRHIPYALPGEVVRLDEVGGLAAVVSPSPQRVAPFCPHYGVCGGCKLQHLAAGPYQEWKRDLVVTALARAGLEATVAPLIPAHGEGRRRVTLHARFERGQALVGFMMAKTHDIIAIERCPVLTPALGRAPEVARAVVAPLSGLRKPVDVQITAADGGLDVDLRGPGKIDDGLRLALSRLAERLDLARLSLHGDTIVERHPPMQRMGASMVTPPAGGFLQATALGEATLAGLVEAAVGKARRVVDLFCGAGPFALRLARTRAVAAYDSDRPAIEALTRAARATPGLKPITAEARDLFRRPLLAPELAGVDAVVLDPARAGAEAQVRHLVRASGLKRLVYVSCDVQSFTRDARLLCDGGFRLATVTPVDQFAYTPHIELVGEFSR